MDCATDGEARPIRIAERTAPLHHRLAAETCPRDRIVLLKLMHPTCFGEHRGRAASTAPVRRGGIGRIGQSQNTEDKRAQARTGPNHSSAGRSHLSLRSDLLMDARYAPRGSRLRRPRCLCDDRRRLRRGRRWQQRRSGLATSESSLGANSDGGTGSCRCRPGL